MTDIDRALLKKVYKELKEVKNRMNHLFLQEYSLREVAAELKLSESTLYKIDPIKLPYFKRGKFRVYQREDVIQYKIQLESSNIRYNLDDISD